MSQEPVKNHPATGRKVVFSPLDWGLGHTTRSIPLLQTLEHLGFSLIIACNSTQFNILHPHFPGARFEKLEGYHINFGKSRAGTLFRIAFQAPKILTRIKAENAWLKDFCLAEKPDLVLSDSRFGFWFPGCPSIMLTHQLQIRTGLGSIADRLTNYYNRNWMANFDQVWVADHPQTANRLAGQLSTAPGGGVTPFYLGPLSRFAACTTSTAEAKGISVVLSGPEPQRTLLEEKIIAEALSCSQALTLVRGLPADTALPSLPPFITCYNHLDTEALQHLFCNSAFVISRSGYSSLMDYAATGTKAILIPTPGQAEQEYLAEHCQSESWALAIPQSSFQLKKALVAAAAFPYSPFPETTGALKKAVSESLRQLGVLPLN